MEKAAIASAGRRRAENRDVPPGCGRRSAARRQHHQVAAVTSAMRPARGGAALGQHRFAEEEQVQAEVQAR
jgi:hypothetical protein